MPNASGVLHGQSVGQWPAAFDSERQRGRRDPDALRPGFEHHRLTVERDKSCAGPVAGLLVSRRPPAVFGRVISIVVDAVNRKANWLFPHVSQEVGKAIGAAPSLANFDAAAAVSVKNLVRRVSATVVHGGPYSVGRGLCHAVLARRRGAATGELLQSLEQGGRHVDHIPAVTRALPYAARLVADTIVADKVLRDKHAKSLAGQIFAAVERLFRALAAAGRGSTAAEVVGCAYGLVSAVAQTKPKRLAGCVSACWSLGYEAAKALACEVKRCGHACLVRMMVATHYNQFGASNAATV